MSGADTHIRRKAEPVFTRVDDELLGLDTQSGLAYSLNRSAARVWELLEDWTTVDAICAQLQREYSVEPEACAPHVRTLIARLDAEGLVERQDGGSS